MHLGFGNLGMERTEIKWKEIHCVKGTESKAEFSLLSEAKLGNQCHC